MIFSYANTTTKTHNTLFFKATMVWHTFCISSVRNQTTTITHKGGTMFLRTVTAALLLGGITASVIAGDYTSGKTIIIRDDDYYQKQQQCESCGQSRRAAFFAPQVLWFDKEILQRLTNYETDLQQLGFDMTDNRIFMLGGMGYSENDAGVRVGSGLWIGYKKYTSTVYEGPYREPGQIAPAVVEELYTTLRIIPVYAGMLVEKNFDLNYVTLFAGGFFGGGALLIHKIEEKAGDIFFDDSDYEYEYDANDSLHVNAGAIAVAPGVYADLHGGVAVKLAPSVQLGLEGVLTFAYAPDGFVTGAGFGDFVTVSPGLRARLIFGRNL
jgi:hypothetical protein